MGCTVSTVENDRWALNARVREILGEREGDILMEHLPPAGWSHLATRDDLALTRAELRQDMSKLKVELRQEMSEIRMEMSEIRVEMSEIKAELKGDIAELRADMEKGFRSQTWKMVTAIGASQAVSVGIMAAMVNSLR